MCADKVALEAQPVTSPPGGMELNEHDGFLRVAACRRRLTSSKPQITRDGVCEALYTPS